MTYIFKNYFFLFIVFCLILQNCATNPAKISEINSRVSFEDLIKTDAMNKTQISSQYKNLNHPNPNQFIDSVRQKLIADREVLVDIKYRSLTDQIRFDNAVDTIYMSNIKIKSPSGGIPAVYEYNVSKNDIIFYEFKNSSIHTLQSISLLEGSATRFRQEKFKRKHHIKGSFVVTSDNTLSLNITNNNRIKNFGFFKSKLDIQIKTLGSVKLTSEIVSDTIFTTKKIMETIYDTIYKIESNHRLNLGSKQNLSLKNGISIPLLINSPDSIIAWSYWIGLNNEDTIDVSLEKENILAMYSKNEINNSYYDISNLESVNNEIDIMINNESLDRRSLNFSNNFVLYQVDNNFTKPNNKGSVLMTNKSNLYDYNIQFVLLSISLKPRSLEVEKEIGEINKYVKLKLEYND